MRDLLLQDPQEKQIPREKEARENLSERWVCRQLTTGIREPASTETGFHTNIELAARRSWFHIRSRTGTTSLVSSKVFPSPRQQQLPFSIPNQMHFSPTHDLANSSDLYSGNSGWHAL